MIKDFDWFLDLIIDTYFWPFFKFLYAMKQCEVFWALRWRSCRSGMMIMSVLDFFFDKWSDRPWQNPSFNLAIKRLRQIILWWSHHQLIFDMKREILKSKQAWKQFSVIVKLKEQVRNWKKVSISYLLVKFLLPT